MREPGIVARWRALGFDGALVGEALVRATDPAAAVRAFVAAGAAPDDLANVARRPSVKVCGITDADVVGDERLMATDPEQPQGPQGDGQPQPPYPPAPAYLSGWVPPPQAPKPGVIPLRPLGVSELLDGAITAIRQYPKAILLPSFVVALGVGAFGYLINLATIGYISDLNNLDPLTADGGDIGRAVGPAVALSLVALLVQFIATVLLTGVIAVVMSQAVLGRPITAGEAWVRIKPQAWSCSASPSWSRSSSWASRWSPLSWW